MCVLKIACGTQHQVSLLPRVVHKGRLVEESGVVAKGKPWGATCGRVAVISDPSPPAKWVSIAYEDNSERTKRRTLSVPKKKVEHTARTPPTHFEVPTNSPNGHLIWCPKHTPDVATPLCDEGKWKKMLGEESSHLRLDCPSCSTRITHFPYIRKRATLWR